MHDPAAYLTPDVTLDVSGVRLEPDGPDRIRSGARGHPAPPSLKATRVVRRRLGRRGGNLLRRPNALARARLAADTIGKRLDLAGSRSSGGST